MADDLSIEITGSAKQAETALNRIIKKIDELQSHFEKVAPSVSKFAAQMDKIASSSKAFSAFQRLAEGADKQAVSTKKAEANTAMYQARLDRANVSMERSRVSSEKLAASLGKVSAAQRMAANNSTAFSMAPAEFVKQYSHTGSAATASQTVPEEPTSNIPSPKAPAMKYNASGIMAQMDAITANISNKTPRLNIDTQAATAEVRRVGEYIDSITPKVSRLSAESQAKFNALAGSLMAVSQQLDNQRMVYRGLSADTDRVAEKNGEGSMAFLRLEKRMLSASAAIDRLIAKQNKLRTSLDGVINGTEEEGNSAEHAANKSTSGWSKTLQMMEKMLIRIAAFRIFSAVQQGITTGLQDMAQANSQANATMSALSTDALYLKNSLAAALMPALQALVPIINQVTDALADAFNTIGMLIARIFNHATTVSIAKRANVNYAETLDKTGNSASDTNKKIKELQRTVMGFDELNLLNKPASDSASKANNQNPGMPSYGSMFETVKIPDWVNNIGNVTDQIGKVISDWWSGLTSTQKWGAGVGGTAGLVIGGIIGGLIGGPIGRVVGAALGAAAGVAIGAWWAGLTSKEKWGAGVGAAVGATIGGVIGGLIAGPVGVVVGASLGATIGAITGKWWTDLTMAEKWRAGRGATAGAIIGGIIGTLIAPGLGTAVGIAIGGSIGLALGENWDQISEWFNQKSIESQKWFGGQWGNFINMFQPNMITKPFADAWATIKGTWDDAGSWFGNIWNEIISHFKPTMITDGFKSAWSAVQGAWNSAGSWFGGIWNEIVVHFRPDIISNVFINAKNSIQSAWGNVSGWFGGVWNQIISHFKPDMISSGFKNAWNSLASWKIPTPHITWGGGGWQATGWIYNVLNTLHLPTQMPKLNVSWYAHGGLFDTPSLVGVGEAGPEAALPLNDKVFSQIAQGIIKNGQSNNSGGLDTERIIDRMDRMEKAIREINVYLYTDDRKIAESSNRGNRLLGRTAPTT